MQRLSDEELIALLDGEMEPGDIARAESMLAQGRGDARSGWTCWRQERRRCGLLSTASFTSRFPTI